MVEGVVMMGVCGWLAEALDYNLYKSSGQGLTPKGPFFISSQAMPVCTDLLGPA